MPFRHGGGEFEGVSLGVPFAGVGISPPRHGARIEIIVDSLYHSCIEQQAFDPVTVPEAALISGRTVDVEILSDNRDVRLVSLRSRFGYDRLNAGAFKAQRRKVR